MEALLYCAQQEIALRGHREGCNSLNRGNFLELLNLIGKHNPIVHQQLECGPRNATYTSTDMQSTLLRLMASNVTSKICSSVKRAGVYSVLADETKDCSKVEQLSIVIRYVDTNTAKIHEHFLTYVKAEFLDAEAWMIMG